MRLIPFVLTAAASFFIMACGDDAKDSDDDGGVDVGPVPTAAFLSVSDLEPGSNLRTLAESDVLDVILGNETLYDTAPKEAETEADKCFSKAVDGKIVATTDSLVFAFSVDTAKCLTSVGFTNTKGSIVAKGYFSLGCKGGDLSEFDGQLYSTLEADSSVVDAACADASERNSIFNSEFVFDYSADYETDGETAQYVVKSRLVSAGYAGSMDHCRQTKNAEGDWANDATCLDVSRDISTTNTVDGTAQDDQGTELFERYENIDLVQSSDAKATWFVSGKSNVRINNWEGTVTYTGVDKPATYEMTSDEGTITGSVDDPNPNE